MRQQKPKTAACVPFLCRTLSIVQALFGFVCNRAQLSLCCDLQLTQLFFQRLQNSNPQSIAHQMQILCKTW
jgi:hypothetical protein